MPGSWSQHLWPRLDRSWWEGLRARVLGLFSVLAEGKLVGRSSGWGMSGSCGLGLRLRFQQQPWPAGQGQGREHSLAGKSSLVTQQAARGWCVCACICAARPLVWPLKAPPFLLSLQVRPGCPGEAHSETGSHSCKLLMNDRERGFSGLAGVGPMPLSAPKPLLSLVDWTSVGELGWAGSSREAVCPAVG